MNMRAGFKLFFGFVLLCLFLSIIALFLTPTSELSTVKDQLKALRENKLSQAYYEYTSKDFQRATSLVEFREFLKSNPYLIHNKTIEVITQTNDEGVTILDTLLISNANQSSRVYFQLKKDEGEWKILGITIQEDAPGLETIAAEIYVVVENQLQALKKNDFVDAYYSYVSKGFQSDTPLTDFQKFVDSYPILSKFTEQIVLQRSIDFDEGFVRVELKQGDEVYTIDYKLVKEEGDWKIFSIKVNLPQSEAQKKISTDPRALIYPVKEMLEAFIDRDVKKAYGTTSLEFQEVTTFEDFEKFVSAYPVLANPEITDFKEGMIENGSGIQRVNLHDKNGITVIEYSLGFEDGGWEIWGMQIVDEPSNTEMLETVGKPMDKLSLIENLKGVVLSQLTALRHFNLSRAYYDYVSEKYREVTPFEAYEQFIEENSELTHARTIEFNKVMMDTNEANLQGVLTLMDYRQIPVEYTLELENGSWKIGRVKMIDSKEVSFQKDYMSIEDFTAPPKKAPFIERIEVGTKQDPEGNLIFSSDRFRPSDEELYVNLFLADSTLGESVRLYFEHIDSGSGISPFTTMLEKDGDMTLTFSYDAPDGGWPEGQYVLKATTSSGKEILKRFSVVDSD